MRDLGVKLQPVYSLFDILDRAQRVIGLGRHLKPGGGDRHVISVAHPDGKVLREMGEQPRVLAAEQLDPRRAVFAATRRLDLSAQEVAYKLQAITDAEDRNPQIDDLRAAMRGSVFINGARPAGEYYPLRIELAYFLYFHAEWMDFAVDAQLTNPPRYQLTVLRAEIEYQDGLERFGHEIAPSCDLLNFTESPVKRRVYVSGRRPDNGANMADGGNSQREHSDRPPATAGWAARHSCISGAEVGVIDHHPALDPVLHRCKEHRLWPSWISFRSTRPREMHDRDYFWFINAHEQDVIAILAHSYR